MPRAIPAALARRLRQVRLFLCDVDGVLTDATVTIGARHETKSFHIRDGLGLRLLQEEGIKVGWVSARPSVATRRRAEELKVDFLHQALGSKVEAVEGILRRTRLDWSALAYMGDDIIDLGVMRRAAVSAAPADAVAEVREQADFVARANGGHGAVREVVELILRAQGRWTRLVRKFTS